MEISKKGIEDKTTDTPGSKVNGMSEFNSP